jgi:hypothetical protein
VKLAFAIVIVAAMAACHPPDPGKTAVVVSVEKHTPEHGDRWIDVVVETETKQRIGIECLVGAAFLWTNYETCLPLQAGDRVRIEPSGSAWVIAR